MRRLIVNADDFGYTSGVNRAIVEAHSRGVVTSSTLMANGAAFAEAAQLSSTVPNLSVGCHVVLTDGEPVLGAGQLPSLTTASHFRDGMIAFASRAIAGVVDANQITAEAAAQIRKIQSAGIAVSHFDTHKHTHLFPTILRPLLRAAGDCGVRAVRNPFGPRLPPRSSHLLTRPTLWTRYVEVRILRAFAGKFREAVDREGFATPDGTLGIVVTGALYCADRRMKTDDNYFRGFPALWNLAAFYLFLLRPPPFVGAAAVALLVVATFLPFYVIHPVRVERWRRVNLAVMVIWGVLVVFTLVAVFGYVIEALLPFES